MMKAWAMLVMLGGCQLGPFTGTAVGNPGEADAKVSERSTAVVFDLALLPIDRLWLEPCSSPPFGLPVQRDIQGLEPTRPPIRIPSGKYCALSLLLDGPMRLEGTTPFGTDFTAFVPIEALDFYGDIAIDGDRVLFEVPLPIDERDIDDLGPDPVIDIDDPVAISLAQDATEGVVLYLDADDDGLVSGPDRLIMAVAPNDTGTGPNAFAVQDAQGCGCGGGRGPLGPVVLLVLGLLWRRRYCTASTGASVPSRVVL